MTEDTRRQLARLSNAIVPPPWLLDLQADTSVGLKINLTGIEPLDLDVSPDFFPDASITSININHDAIGGELWTDYLGELFRSDLSAANGREMSDSMMQRYIDFFATFDSEINTLAKMWKWAAGNGAGGELFHSYEEAQAGVASEGEEIEMLMDVVYSDPEIEPETISQGPIVISGRRLDLKGHGIREIVDICSIGRRIGLFVDYNSLAAVHLFVLRQTSKVTWEGKGLFGELGTLTLELVSL